MEIRFSSRKFEKLCNSDKEMRRRLDPRNADRLQQRLAEFTAADALDDISRLPPARCHELTGDRKGQLAVDLVHPKRLVFAPDHDPLPKKPDGGLDWALVTRVLVIEIVNYH